MGWASWNSFAAKIDYSVIKQQVDAFVAAGLPAARAPATAPATSPSTTPGFDFVKVDWCGGDAEGLDAATTYRSISDAVAKAAATTGRPLTLSLCNWGKQNPWNWAPGQAPMRRTSTDIIRYGNSPSMTNLLSHFDQTHPISSTTRPRRPPTASRPAGGAAPARWWMR